MEDVENTSKKVETGIPPEVSHHEVQRVSLKLIANAITSLDWAEDLVRNECGLSPQMASHIGWRLHNTRALLHEISGQMKGCQEVAEEDRHDPS